MKICVFGAASPRIDKMYIDAVYDLGKALAMRGHSLVFGGGANGLMGAAARGVTDGGGEILGVIPSFFGNERIEAIYDKCDNLIETESMRDRKKIMEDTADAFIIVPGGIGTFEEFFEVLTLKQLRRHNKPIAIFNLNGYYDEMTAAINHSIKEKFIMSGCLALYRVFDSTDGIFEYIETPEENKQISELKDG